MRFALLLVVTLAIQPSLSFDFSSFSTFWEDVKGKIESFVRGNGTLTGEQQELLEKLNKTDVAMDDFHTKLEEIRELVKGQIKENEESLNKTALKVMIEKFDETILQHIRKTGDNVEEINEKLHVAENFYQGDMLLTQQQMTELTDENASKRQAFVDGSVGRRWGTVYYSYANGIKAHTRTVSDLAIKFWQENTCINFQQSTTQANRINIFEGQGCYSYVGQVGRVQELSLGTGCDSVGTAAHEFGHALGFFHEQSRFDRDNAITLVSANVQRGWLDQFNKETTRTNNNYGAAYDYGSIMQYAGTSASGNGKPTMMAKQTQYQDTMGSDIVSFKDLSVMNDLYSCKARCATSKIKCQNNGFPHPRDCNKCLCPAGFGGTLCDQRPTGCGTTLVATKTAQTLTQKVGAGTTTEKDEFTYCNWWITAPTGSRIQATITAYARNACTSGCVYGGVELKFLKNTMLTGSRYCCPNDVNETVTSETNLLPVIAFNRYGAESFTISYKIV